MMRPIIRNSRPRLILVQYKHYALRYIYINTGYLLLQFKIIVQNVDWITVNQRKTILEDEMKLVATVNKMRMFNVIKTQIRIYKVVLYKTLNFI